MATKKQPVRMVLPLALQCPLCGATVRGGVEHACQRGESKARMLFLSAEIEIEVTRHPQGTPKKGARR